jgi:hypothetical protein
MVETVKDWKTIEAYAGLKQGFYQILEDQKTTEIRVHVGRLGYKKQFQNKEDPNLKEIIDFCKSKNYIQISNYIMDQFFFEHIPEE